jgi:hypothetical protein
LGKGKEEGSRNTAVATEVIKGGGGEKEHCSNNRSNLGKGKEEGSMNNAMETEVI